MVKIRFRVEVTGQIVTRGSSTKCVCVCVSLPKNIKQTMTETNKYN